MDGKMYICTKETLKYYSQWKKIGQAMNYDYKNLNLAEQLMWIFSFWYLYY